VSSEPAAGQNDKELKTYLEILADVIRQTKSTNHEVNVIFPSNAKAEIMRVLTQ